MLAPTHKETIKKRNKTKKEKKTLQNWQLACLSQSLEKPQSLHPLDLSMLKYNKKKMRTILYAPQND